MQNENYDDIEDFDEDGIDCECDLDFDDEEDFDEEEYEEEKPKKKSKTPEKSLDDYLTVLRTLFDVVELEVLPYERQPNVDLEIENYRGSDRTYCRILCRNRAETLENKNPNIEYVNWVEFQIRNENGWPKEHVKYLIDNYKQLVKDEDMNFFMKENVLLMKDERRGLNYYLFYKSRKLNPIPSFEEMMEMRKATLQHIFQNGLYEEDNPRIDSFDEYWFEGYCFKRDIKDFRENGATDIELVDVFGLRLSLGTPHMSQRYDGEEYMSYPYWCDGSKINDSGNNIEYSYKESVFNKDYISWLREFTGWKTKTYGSFDDEVVKELVEVLAHHHRIEVDEMMRLVKKFNDPKVFQKALNEIYLDSNGGGGGGQYMCLFGRNYERTKTGLEVSLTARKPHLEHYGFWSDNITRNRYGDTFYVFEGNAYQKIWEYYNPKPKVLDLFSMFDDEEPAVPVNNIIESPKIEMIQISLF